MNGIYVLGSLLLGLGIWVGGMQFGFNQARKDIAELEKQRELDRAWRTKADVNFALILRELEDIKSYMPKRGGDKT